MKIDKRAAMGEGVFMIYRLILVSVIAFAIFGISSIFYAYEIEVRDAEAVILTRQVSECLSPEGFLNLNAIPENSRRSLLSHCGISFIDRFYVGVEVFDSAGNIVAELSQGDSGANWVQKITGGEGKYDPGYVLFEYPVLVGQGISEIEGKVKMEVVISHGF
jgi:hypothetical protein